MSAPPVVVIGGGLAGLSAALTCADAGAQVTLLEGRPRLGGATWSFERDGLEIDNGQHVFLRCCTAYRSFLRRLGVEHQTHLQSRLEIPVADPEGRLAWMRRSALPAPLHLASSLLRFAHVPFVERIRIGRLVREIGSLDLSDTSLDDIRLGDWLRSRGASGASLTRFWDLLIRATLNVPAAEASLRLSAKVFQTGLLESNDGADLGYATVSLRKLHEEPARRALEALGARVRTRAQVASVRATGEKSATVALRSGGGDGISGETLASRAVIVATDHESAAALLPVEAGVDPAALRALGRSPIVNLHLVYERPVTDRPFLATVDSPLQWIFDRSEASGLKEGQYLAISLSAADAYVGQSQEALRARFVPEIERLFKAARETHITHFFATCERAATFDQRAATHSGRVGAQSAHPAIFVAGAWTDTGWPATMEGAVRSGYAAAHAALAEIGIAQLETGPNTLPPGV